jgi:hypothetical protein
MAATYLNSIALNHPFFDGFWFLCSSHICCIYRWIWYTCIYFFNFVIKFEICLIERPVNS